MTPSILPLAKEETFARNNKCWRKCTCNVRIACSAKRGLVLRAVPPLPEIMLQVSTKVLVLCYSIADIFGHASAWERARSLRARQLVLLLDTNASKFCLMYVGRQAGTACSTEPCKWPSLLPGMNTREASAMTTKGRRSVLYLKEDAISLLEDMVNVSHRSAVGNISYDAHMRCPALLQHLPDLPATTTCPQGSFLVECRLGCSPLLGCTFQASQGMQICTCSAHKQHGWLTEPAQSTVLQLSRGLMSCAHAGWASMNAICTRPMAYRQASSKSHLMSSAESTPDMER